MKQDNQQSRFHDEGQIMNPEEQSRHKEGSSWASTPEMRAKEGVCASFREDPQVVREGDAAHSESTPSPPFAPASASQTYDAYDPYLHARHDTYQHHQYDDYYLMDDYYYHDDYYPHLYYDTPAQPTSRQEAPSIDPSRYEPTSGYDPFAYRDHGSNWQEERQPVEALASSGAAAAGLAWTEERVQEIAHTTIDPGSYAGAQASHGSDSIYANQDYAYQTNQVTSPSELAQPYQAAHIQELPATSLANDRHVDTVLTQLPDPTVYAHEPNGHPALQQAVEGSAAYEPSLLHPSSPEAPFLSPSSVMAPSSAPIQPEPFEHALFQPSQDLMNESHLMQEPYQIAQSDSRGQLLTFQTADSDLQSSMAKTIDSSASEYLSDGHAASILSLSSSADMALHTDTISQVGTPSYLRSEGFGLSSVRSDALSPDHFATEQVQSASSKSAFLIAPNQTESLLDNNVPQQLHDQPLADSHVGHMTLLADGFALSSLHPFDDLKLEPVMADVPTLLALQHNPNEASNAQNRTLGGLLTDQGSEALHSDDLLSVSEDAACFIGSKDSLHSDSNVLATVLNHSEAKDVGHRGHELHEQLEKVGTAALGTLELSGSAVQAGVIKMAGALDFAANQLLREDEDLKRAADLDDVIHDGLVVMNRHGATSDSESMIGCLLSSERSFEGAIEGITEKHAPAHARKTGHSGNGVGDQGDTVLKVKETRIREKPEAANARDLFAASQTINIASSKGEMLEKGPSGLKSVALEAGNHEGAEKHLLNKDKDVPDEKKKAVTERERALEKKKADRKAAKKEKNDSKALSVVKTDGKLAAKGALLIGGIAASSTKKALASRNEEIAVAVSTVDKTKKTVKGVKTLVRTPFTIYRYARRAVQAVVSAVKSLFNFAATLTSMGPAGAVIALALFFLVIVVIVILFATASIINDEQEVSEVSALVAELDAELTEDIQSLGDQPILYLDAKDTYGQKGDGDKSLTKNVDLADQESDLQKVVASSVTVQTDPGEIAAYIDAKYTGNWQVGAASWKYTIDAFGESWNVIEWDDMPEWAWKGLNKINRGDFESTLASQLKNLLMEEFELDESLARSIANDTADEFAVVIYDNQIQGINEDILMQIIKDCVKNHKDDLDLTNDQTRKLYYQMQQTISNLIGEEDPFAFVYDEIVLLHERMNYWSEEYDSFETSSGGMLAPGTGSGGNNKYGYPNSSGYNPSILSSWDGYNEVSVYGISEAGTGSVTGDGTRITNTWDDANMGIACEGLQNYLFAYWTTDYKNATGLYDGEPVKITLMNPETGKSVTAEVVDCGGWRGFNPNYAGMNADRQWDLLPAVWKALGGAESAGTMKVYWKVDPDAIVGSASVEPKVIEDYPWPKETDENDGTITITHPTLVVHGIQDALNNNPLMEEIIDKDTFATETEFKMVRNFVVTKVKDVMKTLLTMENSEGESYVDYNYIRRNLGNPFGDDENGDPREWVVTHRFNPGYEEFDEDEAYVEVKPLSDTKTVKAILEGEVEEVDDGRVVVRSYIDTANSSEVVYSELTDIKVEKGDEIKEGQTIGKMADDVLRISYYEINDAALQIETKKDWAYDPGLYMIGFAGYEKPSEPEEHIGTSSDYSGCQTVVEFAHSRLGCPYIWGATGPNTFDCSGLTQWCYAKAGISIPRNSEAQHDAAAAAGNVISLSNLQPGDILWKPGHVGIYIGNNQYIHAPKPGDVVKISTGVNYFSAGLRFG